MTLTEFYAALEQTPRTWRVRFGLIRNGTRCPIDAVNTALGSNELSVADYRDVMGAADNLPSHSKRIRAALLKATGLK